MNKTDSAQNFIDRLISFKFRVPNTDEWAIGLKNAEDIVQEMGQKIDVLQEQLTSTKTDEVKFYQEEKRVLDALEVCRKCKHLINGECKLKAICKRVAIDYYEEEA